MAASTRPRTSPARPWPGAAHAVRRATLAGACLLVAACRPSPPAQAAATDSAAPAAAQPGAAELFAAGVISDANRQWRITFTPDGNTAYFAESEGFFPATRQATIHVSQRVNGAWTEPVVAPFSGQYSDIDPFVTPDGRRLYFSSIRPVDGAARTDIDLWYVERTASGWSAPVHLGPEVNSPVDELYPSLSAQGELYLGVGPAAPGASADWDIYRAARRGDGFAPREPVAAVNTDLAFDASNPTADWEFNPEVSADGRTLVFTSLRPGGHGYGDLYVSRLRDGAWSPPENLGPAVNSAADEYHPTLAADGMLYFVRNDFKERVGDFFRVDARVVGLR